MRGTKEGSFFYFLSDERTMGLDRQGKKQDGAKNMDGKLKPFNPARSNIKRYGTWFE